MTRILLLLICFFCVSAFAADQPNIVLILVDDMGVMDTSVPFLTNAQGKPQRYPLNDFYRTPNMERLAAQGVRFNNFYAMSVCSPTRVSIMTGQNAARHRTTNWISPDQNNRAPQGPPDWNWRGLQPGAVTLAALLKTGGYRTIHVGKGHFGPRNTEGADPSKLGFEVNVGGAAIGQPGSYYGKNNFGDNPANNDKNKKSGKRAAFAVPGLDKYYGQDIFLTEALTLEAQQHVSDAVQAGKPFFLYFPQYAVHGPHQSDPRFAKHYQQSGKGQPAQNFATLIEGMDKSLGDMLAHLEKLGVAENTLVIFLGDNGSDAPLGKEHEVACAAPLRGKKGTHYEGGMRVPFIAAWAKPNANHPQQQKLPIAQGVVQSQLAAVYDLFPTILQLANQSAPPGYTIDGTSLQTLFTGQSDASRKQTFLMHYPHTHRSNYFTVYRDGDWKVIYHYFPSPASENSHYQLFNLKEDPFEQRNLATSHPNELKRLMTGLVAAMQQQGALYPVEKDGTTEFKPKLP